MLAAGKRAAEVVAERRQQRVQSQRDEQQEARAEEQHERPHVFLQEQRPRVPGLRLDAPDRVERVLELAEDGRRPHEQRGDAQHGRQGTLVLPMDVAQHVLQGLGAGHPDQIRERAGEPAGRRVLAEDLSPDADHEDQERRDREDRVEGERRPEPRRPMQVERLERRAEEPERLAERQLGGSALGTAPSHHANIVTAARAV